MLSLLRVITHGNAIPSTYGTNFEYIVTLIQFTSTYLPTQAIVYDHNCSCGLYPNCTSEALFFRENSSELVSIKGFKVGCTPSESFLASTLECYYDLSCVNSIRTYTNRMLPLAILESPINTSHINSTIAELIDDLFINRWSTAMNFSAYFHQCSPLSCSYAFTQQFSLLYAATVVLGLQGGLAIVLKWICPQIILFIYKLHKKQNQRKNTVHPINHSNICSMGNVDEYTGNSHVQLEPVTTAVILQYVRLFSCLIHKFSFLLLGKMRYQIFAAYSRLRYGLSHWHYLWFI